MPEVQLCCEMIIINNDPLVQDFDQDTRDHVIAESFLNCFHCWDTTAFTAFAW